MVIKSIVGFVGKKELTALGVLAVIFAALLAFDLNVWSFVAVSVLFIVYASWTSTAYLATQQSFNRKTVATCALPVGLATLETLVCLGLVWLVVWAARLIFGH